MSLADAAEDPTNHRMGNLGDRRSIGGRPACSLVLDHVADDLTEYAAALEQLRDEVVEGVRWRG
jgi:hypothetical protein